MTKVEMTVNGAPVSGEVEGRTLLVEFLRDHLRLTGHPCGMRHQPVRRLRGACGRRGR
jgi:aerobic-type carbon monoxide dehydrogenase small subunit (CoxS/CutS family)